MTGTGIGIEYLPKELEWLKEEEGPKIICEALKLFNTQEYVGTKNNPVILGWAKELGISKTYNSDSVAW